MTKWSNQSDSVRISLLDSSSDQHIQIQQAWLPMAIWDGVRVQVKARRGLTLMERFVIECLLELGSCSDDDLGEIAGVPDELAGWMLASLEQKGLACRQQGDLFAPAAETCLEALACSSVETQREEQRTVLLFPETDEFVVLKEGGDFARMLRKTVPMGRYPLPERYKRKSRASLLSEALKSGRVYSEDCDAICAIVDNEIVKEVMCPAYHAAAELPSPGLREWRLTLRGRKRERPGRTDGTGDIREEAPPEFNEHAISLPVLTLLANKWLAQLEHAVDDISVQIERIGLSSAVFRSGVFRASLDGKAATQMACDRLLTERAGLSICVDREIEYEVPLELSPVDDSARRIFALDKGVREVLCSKNGLEAMKVVCGDDQSQRNALVERMWQMKLYGTIYRLREVEDFCT
jgi:hypothetical protein